MPEYDNTNTGSLFTNDKGDNPKRPDRSGMINVDGKEYWLSGWIKTVSQGKRQGEKMLSLSVKPKEARMQDNEGYGSQTPPPPAAPQGGGFDQQGGSQDNSEVPF